MIANWTETPGNLILGVIPKRSEKRIHARITTVEDNPLPYDITPHQIHNAPDKEILAPGFQRIFQISGHIRPGAVAGGSVDTAPAGRIVHNGGHAGEPSAGIGEGGSLARKEQRVKHFTKRHGQCPPSGPARRQ